MPATALDIIIEQGATFSQAIALGANTWDGQTVRASIRRCFGGPAVVDLTGVIAAGVLTLSLTATQTAALTAPAWARADERDAQLGVYDVESVSGETVTRHRYGKVTLRREATT